MVYASSRSFHLHVCIVTFLLASPACNTNIVVISILVLVSLKTIFPSHRRIWVHPPTQSIQVRHVGRSPLLYSPNICSMLTSSSSLRSHNADITSLTHCHIVEYMTYHRTLSCFRSLTLPRRWTTLIVATFHPSWNSVSFCTFAGVLYISKPLIHESYLPSCWSTCSPGDYIDRRIWISSFSETGYTAHITPSGGHQASSNGWTLHVLLHIPSPFGCSQPFT